jgi:hypothetical protein
MACPTAVWQQGAKPRINAGSSVFGLQAIDRPKRRAN